MLWWLPTIKLFSLLLHNSNLSTVTNRNESIFGESGLPRGCEPHAEKHWFKDICKILSMLDVINTYSESAEMS